MNVRRHKELRMHYLIRQLNESDAQAFQRLRRDVTQANPLPMGLSLDEELGRPIEGFRQQLSFPAPNAAFGAFVKDELVGTAAVARPSKFPSSRHKTNLWGVFVHPRSRRVGIGRDLTVRAVEHAFENNVRRVNLQVYVPNPEAVALYTSLGFVVCGTEPEAVCLDGTYYDGVYMSLLRSAA